MPDITFNQTISIDDCCECGGPIALTASLKDQLLRSHKRFCCPLGHWQSYIGETDAERLRKELGAVRAKLDQAEAAKRDALLRAEAADNAKARTEKRAKAGVCPCCRRTFQQLVRHMKSKHPERKA
jgi:hypothetical protein